MWIVESLSDGLVSSVRVYRYLCVLLVTLLCFDCLEASILNNLIYPYQFQSPMAA